jgi:hypothetical protein
MYELGITLVSLGRYSEAGPTIRNVLSVCEEWSGEENAGTAKTNNWVFRLEGLPNNAEEVMRKYVALKTRSLGSNNCVVVSAKKVYTDWVAEDDRSKSEELREFPNINYPNVFRPGYLKTSGHDLHKEYARYTKGRLEGHALCRNVPAKMLKPGTCGYFDDDGDWQIIVHTTDAEALTTNNLPPLRNVRTFTDDGKKKWKGPIKPGDVTGHRVDLHVHGSDGNKTIVAGGKLEFTSTENPSAILVAEGDVEHHQAIPETEFRRWGSANAQALIDLSREQGVIKRRGFWIVTETYTAKKCSISIITGQDSKTSYIVDAKSHGVEVGPTMEWWSSRNDEHWRELSHVSPLEFYGSEPSSQLPEPKISR